MNGNKPLIDCPLEQSPIPFSACPAEELDDILSYLSERHRVPNYTAQRGSISEGRLDLCKQSLGSSGAKRLYATLLEHQNHATKSLLLGTNGLGDQGAKDLAEYITKDQFIETLYLGCNSITAEGTKSICEALKLNNNIKALWLKRNRIGDTGVKEISQLLETRDLRTLDLVNVGMSKQGLSYLVDSITINSSKLENLYLGANYLDQTHVPQLVNLLQNSKLKCLYLGVNRLADTGTIPLLEAITESSSLQLLSLPSNNLSSKSIPALKNALSSSRILQIDLGRSLSEQKLGSQPNQLGSKAFDLTTSTHKLQSLDLSHNNIPTKSVDKLLNQYANSTSLKYLKLNGNLLTRLQKRQLTSLNSSRSQDRQHLNPDAKEIISRVR